MEKSDTDQHVLRRALLDPPAESSAPATHTHTLPQCSVTLPHILNIVVLIILSATIGVSCVFAVVSSSHTHHDTHSWQHCLHTQTRVGEIKQSFPDLAALFGSRTLCFALVTFGFTYVSYRRTYWAPLCASLSLFLLVMTVFPLSLSTTMTQTPFHVNSSLVAFLRYIRSDMYDHLESVPPYPDCDPAFKINVLFLICLVMLVLAMSVASLAQIYQELGQTTLPLLLNLRAKRLVQVSLGLVLVSLPLVATSKTMATTVVIDAGRRLTDPAFPFVMADGVDLALMLVATASSLAVQGLLRQSIRVISAAGATGILTLLCMLPAFVRTWTFVGEDRRDHTYCTRAFDSVILEAGDKTMLCQAGRVYAVGITLLFAALVAQAGSCYVCFTANKHLHRTLDVVR